MTPRHSLILICPSNHAQSRFTVNLTDRLQSPQLVTTLCDESCSQRVPTGIRFWTAKERRSRGAERDAFRARIITLTNWSSHLKHRRCWPGCDDTETFVH